MSLAEAIARSLEKGQIGIGPNSGTPTGQASLELASFRGSSGGPIQTSSDPIRALALAPAVQAANIEASLSKFDTVFQSSMVWNVTDRPIEVRQESRSGS